MTSYEGLETPTNDSGYSSLASSQNDLITSSSDLQVRVGRKKYCFFYFDPYKNPIVKLYDDLVSKKTGVYILQNTMVGGVMAGWGKKNENGHVGKKMKTKRKGEKEKAL